MTLSRKPTRRQQGRTAAFAKQAATEKTEQLHCEIPASLHGRLRVLDAEERTTMKELVVSAIEKLLANRT